MAMHWMDRVSYGALGVTAAVVAALGAATGGLVAGVRDAFIESTPVTYPSLKEINQLKLIGVNDQPGQLQGLHFDPNETVDVYVLSAAELPIAQYLLWTQVKTNAAGEFAQTLNASLPASASAPFYLSAKGKRGYVPPVGPISLPKAEATQAPAPTSQPPQQNAAPAPTATPLPVNTLPVSAYYVEYFDNRDLADTAIITRNETAVNMSKGNAEPFSMRYVGKWNFPGPESYEFVIVADDGVRLFIDNNSTPVLNEWRVGKSREKRVDVPLTSGEHTITLEYFHRNGNAQLKMDWRVYYSRWEGRYYNTPDWTGPVVFKRDDGDGNGFLDMTTWGNNNPGTNVNADNFSVSWERRAWFENRGDYKFTLAADDNARVYIDGLEIFRNPDVGNPHEFTCKLGRGYHQLQVMYAEYGGEAKIKLTWAFIPPPPVPVP